MAGSFSRLHANYQRRETVPHRLQHAAIVARRRRAWRLHGSVINRRSAGGSLSGRTGGPFHELG